MDEEEFDHVVWCDLQVVQLKIHSVGAWDTTLVNVDDRPDPAAPTVNVFLCPEDDEVFSAPATYRERIVRTGSYRGHTFGPPARLALIDEANIAIAHPDPGRVIWSLIVKYVLTAVAARRGLLHAKGAAVGYGGKAFLLLGRGGSGKTEMATVLAAHGAEPIANTHLLIVYDRVCGVQSNIRVRRGDTEVHLRAESRDGVGHGPDWWPIGGAFWVDYRTDGVTLLEPMPPRVARPNLAFFTEAVRNWELKEDLADLVGPEPAAFAAEIQRIETSLDGFCQRVVVQHANLDIRSPAGLVAMMSALRAGTVS